MTKRGEKKPSLSAAPDSRPVLEQARAHLQEAADALPYLLETGFQAEGEDAGLRLLYQHARKKMKQAHKTGSDEDLHAWRRPAKDLFYVLEMIGAPGGLVKKFQRLTQLLGDDHDLAAFISHHHPRAEKNVHSHLLKRAKKRRGPLQKKAFGLGAKLFDAGTKSFAHNLLD